VFYLVLGTKMVPCGKPLRFIISGQIFWPCEIGPRVLLVVLGPVIFIWF